jgi:major vault protein
MAEIEEKKFSSMVAAIGPETLVAMAKAGPEAQAKLLGGLGIKSTLITDGKSPINLFQTAQGLIGGSAAEASSE